jgi:NADH:ubiquinone oxidoreductase subunit D
MSKNREQSAVDAIYELLDEVRELRKEIKIIDNNVKLLNNKILKSTTPAPAQPAAGLPKAAVPVASQQKQSENAQTIKLFGRIKNQSMKPIKGVYIKVYDPNGSIIKSRETDSEGYWEARVVAGQYVVEMDARHINKKFLPKNINIEVNETMNEYEVK